MDDLIWLQDWFTDQIIKDPDNVPRIEISTDNKSNWIVVIDFGNKLFDFVQHHNVSKVKSGSDWFTVSAVGNKFIGQGDASKLVLILEKFRETVGHGKKKSKFKSDKFFSSAIRDFIFEEDENSKIFLHYTSEKRIAEKIVQEGFRFTSSFDKTATEIKNDTIDLNYNHYLRKPFGEHVIVICISKRLYRKYFNLLNQGIYVDIRVEELLCESPFRISEEQEKVFTIHKNFIKGYFNYYEGNIVKNQTYNSEYDCPQFEKNLNLLIEK
jgi:hypothetical protein